MKKAQLTAFMILGIVIIAVLAGVWILNSSINAPKPFKYSSLEDVQVAYEECSSQAFIKALVEIGKQGGHLGDLRTELVEPTSRTSLWSVKQLTSEDVRAELAAEMPARIQAACSELPAEFGRIGVSVTLEDQPQVQPTLSADKTSLDIAWSIIAQQPDRSTRLQTIHVEQEVRLAPLLEFADGVTRAFLETRMINLDTRCSQLDAHIHPIGDDTLLVLIKEGAGTLSDEERRYSFWFALT